MRPLNNGEIMKCEKKGNREFSCDEVETECSPAKRKPNIETRIYNALETAEKIAVKLAQINQIIKKSAKKKKKKNKKLGKVDKKTGTLILKKEKSQKKAKPLKKYKPPKKK